MLTDTDREILELLAVHQLVSAAHIRVHFGARKDLAEERTAILEAARLATKRRVSPGDAGCLQITPAGLSAIGSDLPSPRVDWRPRHTNGAVWLWLAARGGTFGDAHGVLSKRKMQSLDQRRTASTDSTDAHGSAINPAPDEPTFGVRDDASAGGLHYPDVMLITTHGRVAIELQLSAQAPRRLGSRIAAYGSHPIIAGVLYLVADPAVGDRLLSAAASVGLSSLVRIQQVRLTN